MALFNLMAVIAIIGVWILTLGIAYVLVKKRILPGPFTVCILGLFAGLLMGLSSSPILSAAVAGGFAFATSLVKAIYPKQAVGVAPPPPLSVEWTAPLALCALIGVLTGIAVRVNDLLNFRSTRCYLALQGFTVEQVDMTMTSLAHKLTPADVPGFKESADLANHTGLLSNPHVATKKEEWPELWQKVDQKDNAKDKLDLIVRIGPEDIQESVKRARKSKTDEEILNALTVLFKPD